MGAMDYGSDGGGGGWSRLIDVLAGVARLREKVKRIARIQITYFKRFQNSIFIRSDEDAARRNSTHCVRYRMNVEDFVDVVCCLLRRCRPAEKQKGVTKY
jgi:hypothetical protein